MQYVSYERKACRELNIHDFFGVTASVTVITKSVAFSGNSVRSHYLTKRGVFERPDTCDY